MDLNESVEEVRWKLTEDEEVLKKKMQEEEAEEELVINYEFCVPDVEVATRPTRNYENCDGMHSNYENHDVIQSHNKNRDVMQVACKYENVDVTMTSHEYENVAVQKTNNYENVTSSYVNVDALDVITTSSASLRSTGSKSHTQVLPCVNSPQNKHVVKSSVTSPLNPEPKHPRIPATNSFANSTYATIDINGPMTNQKQTSKREAEKPNKEHLNRYVAMFMSQ